ncbi:MAG: glycosyltransferase family 9 protein, partial [Odoribacter sp.]|nr:glycosyltransferase family 9 protein [Odoribacter sp.]
LQKWGIRRFPETAQTWRFPETFSAKWDSAIDRTSVTLVPSANWKMKRWPVQHWQKLIDLLPEYRFVILGGAKDSFCEDIKKKAPERVTNLAGQTSLSEACYLIHQSNIVVSADTGFLHAADLFRRPTLALIGPTAFGFPSGPTAETIEIDLPCRPCTKDGRGKCTQEIYQKCMIDITPERVAKRIRHRYPL